MSASAAVTKRVYVKCENESWRNNADGLHIHIWNSNDANTQWPGVSMTRIGTTEWYYIDIASDATAASCKFTANTSGTIWETSNSDKEIDFKNSNIVIYINSEYTPKVYVNSFDGYAIATGWESTTNILNLTQNGMIMSGKLDMSSKESTDLRIFPKILSEGKYFVGELSIAPNSQTSLQSFWKFSETVVLGNPNNTWYETAHQKYNVKVDLSVPSVEFEPYYEITMGPAGYMTYSNGAKYTVSNASVYTVSANNTNSVSLTEQNVETIYPAADGNSIGDGIILKAEEGATITIHSVGNENASDLGTNYLAGSGDNGRNVTATATTYVFNWDGSNASSVGFYKASGDGTLGAHKAYLDVTGAHAREFLSFDFDGETTTGVSEFKANQNNGVIYNLQGVRQNQLQKGLNIVNGKKVLVK